MLEIVVKDSQAILVRKINLYKKDCREDMEVKSKPQITDWNLNNRCSFGSFRWIAKLAMPGFLSANCGVRPTFLKDFQVLGLYCTAIKSTCVVNYDNIESSSVSWLTGLCHNGVIPSGLLQGMSSHGTNVDIVNGSQIGAYNIHGIFATFIFIWC